MVKIPNCPICDEQLYFISKKSGTGTVYSPHVRVCLKCNKLFTIKLIIEELTDNVEKFVKELDQTKLQYEELKRRQNKEIRE